MTRLNYPGGPLHDVMRATAARFPDRRAITFKDESITFAEFDRDSNRLANGLAALGLASGDRMGLYLPNCPQYELAFYAASKLGAISCPMNPSYREREITYQVNDSGASVMVTHASLWPVVDACRPQLPKLARVVVVGGGVSESDGVAVGYDEVIGSGSTDAPAVKVEQSQLAALPYSSGTTGLPKGVMLTHRTLVCNQLQYLDASGIGPDDAFPLFLPLSHIYGVMLMNAALGSGAHQILMERFDLDTMLSVIQKHGATVLHLVPPVLLALANAPGLDRSQFATVRYALSAAAPLAPDVARRVEQRLGIRVIQAYGLTETGPASHHSPLEPDRIRLESVGVIMADTEQRVVDLETGENVLGPGETGEIIVRGPQVMKGYWNAPEETARALRNGWLYTGDIGSIDRDGYTYLVDRKKEMIKCRAFSIAPAELEAALLEHPDIADCGVVGVPDPDAGEVPNAFVVARKGCTLGEAALNDYFSRRLAGYKMIRKWHLTDAIPRTPSGKILRRMLRERLKQT
ncbi:MAG TPA: AMP-binding protein [Vicinamibacterales bacterium]